MHHPHQTCHAVGVLGRVLNHWSRGLLQCVFYNRFRLQVPLSVETHGRLGQPAVALLETIGSTASEVWPRSPCGGSSMAVSYTHLTLPTTPYV